MDLSASAISAYNFDAFDDGGKDSSMVPGIPGNEASQSGSLGDFCGAMPPAQLMEQDEQDGDISKRKSGWPKGKKRKRMLRDANAPRQPLTGYVRFLNDCREVVRAENPSLSFSEITKLLGAEWSQLPQLKKQLYLNDAGKDKERYMQELEAYHSTNAYKVFCKKQDDKKIKENIDIKESNSLLTTSEQYGGNEQPTTFDIPIFTEEFLDHNKKREIELRQLRRQNTEVEEENGVLGKHIDNMKEAIEKLEVDTVQQRSNNLALQQHLTSLRSTLTNNFSSLCLPGTNELPTLDTIDSYMTKLHAMIIDSPQENESLITTIREIVGHLAIDT